MKGLDVPHSWARRASQHHWLVQRNQDVKEGLATVLDEESKVLFENFVTDFNNRFLQKRSDTEPLGGASLN